MAYFKYKNAILGELGRASETRIYLNTSKIGAEVFLANDSFNEFNCAQIFGSDDEVLSFKASQHSALNLQEINESEFTTLKKASKTYADEQSELARAKERKLQEIQRARDSLLTDSTLEIAGLGTINAGRKHLQNVEALIKLATAQKLKEIDFIMFDNSMKKISLEQLSAIDLQMSARAMSVYGQAQLLKTRINNAQNISEVEAIVWEN